jgi:hypothetical protein
MLQVLLTLAPSMILLAAAAEAAAAVTPPDAKVIARVGDDPVLASDLEAYLRPAPPRTGSAVPRDPRQVALDEAIRVRLFAREAQRRGIQVPDGPAAVVQARLVQALVRQELERHGAFRPAVPEDEARLFFQRHRERLSPVASVRLSAIVLAGAGAPRHAERLLPDAAKADDEGFRRLVARHSMDDSSKARGGDYAQIDHQGQGADDAIAAVALEMRRAGEVGLAVSSDGRYFVLRAAEVRLEPLEWNEATAGRVRHLIAQERRERVLGELAVRLRAATRVSIP